MKDVSIDLSGCKDEKQACKCIIGAELTALYDTIGNEHNAKNIKNKKEKVRMKIKVMAIALKI